MSKFNFKKKYGQNFLNNDDIINKIVDTINPGTKDLIIEIGPGAGALTKKLKKYGANLLAFEIDKDTQKYLIPLVDDKTQVIYEDFLNVDLNSVISTIPHEKIFIIGNLPYYITTPILEKIIEAKIDPESVTIMVQKEVGERFVALPHTKDYGYMTVLLNYWFEIKKVVEVARNNFYPIPNVDSMVIKLSKKERIEVNYNNFLIIIKKSFQFKRKTIKNNLSGYDKSKLSIILSKHGFSLESRAEEINIDTFIDIANNIKGSTK